MFAAQFRMDGILLVAAALCIAVSVMAIHISGRKCSPAKLIIAVILLAGFVFEVSLLLPELQNYNLETSNDLAVILKKGFYLSHYRSKLNYALYLVFNLVYYSLGAFYFTFFSRKRKLGITFLKCTAVFLPLDILALSLRFSDVCRRSRIDYLYFAEIYIGCIIGYCIAKLILSKRGVKENGQAY